MAHGSLTLLMLVSAPSDVDESDLNLIQRTITQWNFAYGRTFGVTVVPVWWSHHAVSTFGGRPQSSINDQLVDQSDMALALFNGRLGTPTGTAESGTAEEIKRMAEAGKHVSILRCTRQQSPTVGAAQAAERLRLEEYLQDEVFKQALVLPYANDGELIQHLNNTLSLASSAFQQRAEDSRRSAPQPDDPASGVWPRVEINENVTSDSQGRVRIGRRVDLVLENKTGRPVRGVSFEFVTGGDPFDVGNRRREPIPVMAPNSTERFPILLTSQSARQAQCRVTWTDERGEHVTEATVRA